MGNGNLRGKVAIVTGGASGIGGAVTRLFVERGARVVAVDLQRDAGEALARELGDAVVFRQGDVSDRAVADAAVAAAVERFGALDTLINNASASRQKPIEEQTDDDWRLAMDTGLYATRNFMLAALPELRKAGGASIVNFGSGAGLDGQPNQASYAAAKEAIRGLSRVAANEWAAYGRGAVGGGAAGAVRAVRGEGAAGPVRGSGAGRRTDRRVPRERRRAIHDGADGHGRRRRDQAPLIRPPKPSSADGPPKTKLR
jgi:NAD(P)-dependent dehydrogenase (short-subunit alcohol dehydrogenase family)